MTLLERSCAILRYQDLGTAGLSIGVQNRVMSLCDAEEVEHVYNVYESRLYDRRLCSSQHKTLQSAACT